MGIRADLVVEHPGECQVAHVTSGGGCVDSVDHSTARLDDEDRVVSEFTYDGDEECVPDGMERAFEFGDEALYRFVRDVPQNCVCDTIEAMGSPVRDYRSERGRLFVCFVAGDIDSLREVIATLKRKFDGVTVQRLTNAGGDDPGDDLVYVDRSELTQRQREVLRVAHESGYFEHPKGANAGEVADELDIAVSTFSEHLSAAQSKLLASIFEADRC